MGYNFYRWPRRTQRRLSVQGRSRVGMYEAPPKVSGLDVPVFVFSYLLAGPERP
jgi:hypothetical protein